MGRRTSSVFRRGTMKLQILSDIHVEFEKFTPPAVDANVVILTGDIHTKEMGLTWAVEAFPDKPVLYVLGNHEYYGAVTPKLLNKLREGAEGTNVTVLENDAVKIGGVTFLGCTLWSDFQLLGDPTVAGIMAGRAINDFFKIRIEPEYRRFQPRDAIRLHCRSLAWLQEQIRNRRDENLVIMTHHAPSAFSVPERYRRDILSAAFASNLDNVVADSGAALWIHGHMHDSQDYMIGETRVVCNPKGYPHEPNPTFAPGLVIEV